MNATYTIEHGNLVQARGSSVFTWAIQQSDNASIDHVFLEDMGGHCFCDVIVLKDGRTILVSVEGAVHEENEGQIACIYPSLDHAYDGDGQESLSVVS